MSHVQFHECSVLSDTLKANTEIAGMTRRNETLSSIKRQDLQGLELGGDASKDVRRENDPTARFITERHCDEPYRTERIEHFRGMAKPAELCIAEIRQSMGQELNRSRRIGWDFHRSVARAGIVTAVDPNGKSGFLPSQEFLTRERFAAERSSPHKIRDKVANCRGRQTPTPDRHRSPRSQLHFKRMRSFVNESQACCHQASV